MAGADHELDELRPFQDIDEHSGDEKSDSALSSRGSLDTLLSEDVELQGPSLFERKAALASRELDSHGMGRYQWCIWLLCGFGYFIDLLWAQAFGLILVSIVPEFGLVGDRSAESGRLATAFNAGLTAGALVWGFLVDIVGRRWAFNGTIFIASVFGMSIGLANDYPTLLILTALCGFGIGGNIPIDTTICLEFLPQNRRFLLAALSLFQPIGTVVSSAIAYGLIPSHSCEVKVQCGSQAPGLPCCDRSSNYGWRYFLFTLGGITFFIFLMRFVAFTFCESPKYLLSRGRDAEAARVLEHIAIFNRRGSSMIGLEHFEAVNTNHSPAADGRQRHPSELVTQQKRPLSQRVQSELSRLNQLFATRSIAYTTILVWTIYVFDYVSFTAAGAYIPVLLSIKGGQSGISADDTYRSYIIIYSPGIAAAMLAAAFYEIPWLGRRWGMLLSSTLQGVGYFLFATARTEAAYVGFNMLEYFMQTLLNAILYGWTPEVFPTSIRGTAAGIASFFGRLFGIIAPIIAGWIWASYGEDTSNPQYGNGVLYFAGVAIWLATAAIFLIPKGVMSGQSL